MDGEIGSPEVPSVRARQVEIIREAFLPKAEGKDLAAFLGDASAWARLEAKKHSGAEGLGFGKAGKRFRLAAKSVLLTEDLADGDIDSLLDKYWLLGIRKKDLPALKHWADLSMALDLALEEKYGVWREDKFKRLVAQEYLGKGRKGTLLALDVVGLKVFNTDGHEYGDAALEKVAGFCHKRLEELGIKPEERLIGRKGDEFYIFIPDEKVVDEGEMSEEKEKEASNRVVEKFREGFEKATDLKIDLPKEKEKGVLVYWRGARVDENNFDEAIRRLDIEIEDEKTRVLRKAVREINEKGGNAIRRRAAFILYLIDKRIEPELIEVVLNADREEAIEWLEGKDLLDSDQAGMMRENRLVKDDIRYANLMEPAKKLLDEAMRLAIDQADTTESRLIEI